MLRDLIGRCDAVIHLAGFHYGAEPPQRPPGQRRRSYTQIEYDVARELKKPLYLFLAAENYESDKPSTQSDEEKELQLTHRRAIEQCGDIYYQFTDREELGSNGSSSEEHPKNRRVTAFSRSAMTRKTGIGPIQLSASLSTFG